MPTIVDYNNGQPRNNPYGKVTQLPSSFRGVDFYDCAIPYKLTNEQLGGYRLTNYYDPTPGQQAAYGPMPTEIKGMRVANFVNIEARYNYPKTLQAAIDSGLISRNYDKDMHCYYLAKDGIRFYEMAVQPFFLRRSVGTGYPSSTDGYFPFDTSNRGQIIDVILTSGKCIHFVLCDINSVLHTNCSDMSHDRGDTDFAPTNYHQYHNIISAFSGNTIEILGQGQPDWGDDYENYTNRKFARKYNLGIWGINGSADIAFYRVYNRRIQDSGILEVTESRMKNIDYDIIQGTPGAYSITINTDNNGVASASPNSGNTGDQITLNYSPNSGYVFDRWQVVSGGILIIDDKFDLGNSNVVINCFFKKDNSPQQDTRPVIEERGIKNLRIDWKRWAKNSGKIRIGDFLILETRQDKRRVVWYDITDPDNEKRYTREQLNNLLGISYTQVNIGYRGKFQVHQAPLPT